MSIPEEGPYCAETLYKCAMHLMYNFNLTILVPSKHHTGIEAVCSSLKSLKNDVIPYKYALSCPSNAVNIDVYYISDPDTFTGKDFKTECSINSVGLSWNLTGCSVMNSARLIDDVTGEGSSPLNTDQFVGWDRQSHDTFIIVPEFNPNTAPRQVDVYFRNNPAMGIGLPPIAVIYVGYNTPHGTTGPVPFTYANNQQLIENSNDSTTMISVVITIDYEAAQFPASFTSFWLQFDFSSTPLSQTLVSEIEIFTEPGKLIQI